MHQQPNWSMFSIALYATGKIPYSIIHLFDWLWFSFAAYDVRTHVALTMYQVLPYQT